MTYVGNNPYACVAIMTASLGLNGAATLTNLQNSQDLAPNFAGTLYAIINFIGTTSGFLSPLVVTYFTKENVRICYRIKLMTFNLILIFGYFIEIGHTSKLELYFYNWRHILYHTDNFLLDIWNG